MTYRVLVTGALGRIGRSTIRQLVAAGHTVLATDLPNTLNIALAKRLDPAVEVLWGDITEPGFWDAPVARVDCVIHLAAIFPPVSDNHPELAVAVNQTATEALLAAMSNSPRARRLVFASSMGVHGVDQASRTPPLTVDSEPRPADIYGRTKLACEQMIRASDLDWIITRIAVCPPVEVSMKDTSMMDAMFQATPDGRLEILHLDDAGLAFANAVRCDAAIGKTLFLGGGPRCQTRVLEFYNRMLGTMGLGKMDPALLLKGSTQYYGDWVDTTESNRLLQYQHHDLDDYFRDIRDSVGAKYWAFKLISPLAMQFIKRRSPNR